jgi:hypothetical protein
MTATVPERANGALAFAHNQDRLINNRVLDEIADIRKVFEPTRDLPAVRPQTMAFELEEVARQQPLRFSLEPGRCATRLNSRFMPEALIA